MAKATTEKLILLDVHAILHRAYHAMPDFTSKAGEPTGGIYGLATMLMRIIKELKPDFIAACYDLPEPTFRKAIYDDYKAGRPKTDESLVKQIIRSRDLFTAFNIPIFEAPGFEADDLLGTIVEKTKGEKSLEVVIASGDMDTLQLVAGKRVKVYTLKKGINDTILYDEAAVKNRFSFSPESLPDYKGLRGDPSDNIIGIKGIGEKTAGTLIGHFGTLEKMYRALKKDEGEFKKLKISPRIIGLLKEGEEEAEFSKTLATIRRDAPVDFVLDDCRFRDGSTLPAVKEFFSELGFKSLLARADQVFAEDSSTSSEQEKKSEIALDQETKIAAWLLDSENSDPNFEDLTRLAGTENLEEAKKFLFTELAKRGLEKVYREIELPLIPIIEAARGRGIVADLNYFKSLSKDYHQKLAQIEKEIYKLAGQEFNINSPKQLGEIIFDKLALSAKGLKKTAGGARSTRESELEKLKEAHPIIAEILQQRELQKLLSTYIDAIPKLADENHVLHSHLRQTGAATGRMSSENPNMQNIPASGELGLAVRRGFIARPGHTFLSADYSQIEMRVLAALSGDPALLEIFKKGEDVHTGVASLVFGVPGSEVTKEMRRRAKVINFGIIYGMGVTRLQATLGVTRAEAAAFYENYFTTFGSIREYFEKVKREARERGYTETFFGRRRYFPGINSPVPLIKAGAERAAMNAPLQGTAADLVKLAMIKIETKLRAADLQNHAHFLLQVHDELVYEVELAKVPETGQIVKQTMETAADIGVPLVTNLSTGQNLGEVK